MNLGLDVELEVVVDALAVAEVELDDDRLETVERPGAAVLETAGTLDVTLATAPVVESAVVPLGATPG